MDNDLTPWNDARVNLAPEPEALAGRPPRRAAAAAATACLCTTLGLAGWAPAPAASAGGWSVVPAQTVTAQNFILNAAAVPAPGDVWVAGYHWENVGGATEFRALAEHYNGKRFVVVPTPDRETAPAVDFLQGLSGTSASDVWAVGDSAPPGAPDQTLVEHWNGTSWSIVASPDPGAVGDILQGVAAISPDDAWAVGARQDTATFYQHPMALHWDGAAWTAVTVPNPAGCTGHSYLTAVSAADATHVWATGWCGSGGSTPDQGYVERWTGSRWTVAAGQGVIPAHSQLYGISAAGPGNVWAVGLTQQPGSSQAAGLTVHWDGTTWTQVAVPGSEASLHAVVASRGRTTWSAGAGTSPQPPFAGPLSLRYGQGAWHDVKVPVAFGSLWGLAFDPGGQLWAAGTHQDSHGFNVPLVLTRAPGTAANG